MNKKLKTRLFKKFSEILQTDDECASVIIIGSKKKDHSPVDRRSGTFRTVDVNVVGGSTFIIFSANFKSEPM